jgi:hypothetical protein
VVRQCDKAKKPGKKSFAATSVGKRGGTATETKFATAIAVLKYAAFVVVNLRLLVSGSVSIARRPAVRLLPPVWRRAMGKHLILRLGASG